MGRRHFAQSVFCRIEVTFVTVVVNHHTAPYRRYPMCQHQHPCPSADAVDREAARIVSTCREQGWSLLCNGVIVFDDTGEILPDGTMIEPHRGPARHALAA
jgi:uncharacterized protein DUF5999